MVQGQTTEPDLEFIRSVQSMGGADLKKCYQCATCSTVCELSPDDKPFPRKEMILATWGQRDRLVSDPDIWLCYQCNDCSRRCPRGARPGDVLAAIRDYVYRYFSFPSFMGKALASPKALPALFLTPVIVLMLCVFLFAPKADDGGYLFLQSEVIDFNLFLPHSSVDALFVFGNLMIFLFAAIGFTRFWRAMRQSGDELQMSFLQGFLRTIPELLSHARFRKCGANHPRAIGHMLLFFGFGGAMITTGAVLVFVFIPHYLSLLGMESSHSFFQVPINLPHPVKILGASSGLALTTGGGLLLYRRWTHRDEVGATGYADYLFLYMLSIAGFTGILSWLTRLSGVPMLAYSNYFVHLVCVYFLLWYMPYSKFAHMIYRTLALTYARCIHRVG